MSLFSYFQLGLRAMDAARLGLQVAGDNIANAATPGFSRRRVELTPGFPIRVAGGFLDQGVDVAAIRRMEDRFLQANLDREKGRLAGGEERLRGLREVESLFGTLGGQGIASALAEFSAAFDELAANPTDPGRRQGAVSAADGLARAIRETYQRLEERGRSENQAVSVAVDRVNTLAGELAKINREIAIEESSGAVAGSLRDKRSLLVEELSELTGGSAAEGPGGRFSFSLPGGPTLVTGDNALPLGTTRAADGTLRVHSGADGRDITDRFRDGSVGAMLYLRDEAISSRLTELDALAEDLVTRANALTSGAFDLQGNPGGPLFMPDPPTQPGAGRRIAVDSALLLDPSLLAVSNDGTPGDATAALALSAMPDGGSAILGGKSPATFLADGLAALGNEIAQTDVTQSVARDLVEVLESRRDSISGVSLDEEAAALIANQRAFEAAARFLDVMNTITGIAVNLGR